MGMLDDAQDRVDREQLEGAQVRLRLRAARQLWAAQIPPLAVEFADAATRMAIPLWSVRHRIEELTRKGVGTGRWVDVSAPYGMWPVLLTYDPVEGSASHAHVGVMSNGEWRWIESVFVEPGWPLAEVDEDRVNVGLTDGVDPAVLSRALRSGFEDALVALSTRGRIS